MAIKRLNVSRDQLAAVFKTHDVIKQFENLFQFADDSSTSAAEESFSIENSFASIVDAMSFAPYAYYNRPDINNPPTGFLVKQGDTYYECGTYEEYAQIAGAVFDLEESVTDDDGELVWDNILN